MEFKSTFDLKIGDKVLLHQQDVMAYVEFDDDDGWWISAVYADAIEIDGECPKGDDGYVEIPKSHFLYKPVLDFFMGEHREDIDSEWSQRRYRRSAVYSTISAGRTL
jgi:hypothetical protein